MHLTPSSAPYTIVHGYWNASVAAAARAEVQELLRLCHERGEGGDNRTLGASRLARQWPDRFPLVLSFERDPVLRQRAAAQLHRPSVTVDTLASVTGPGAASGGGWHKDNLTPGVKALVYLDAVTPHNGPFTMLLGYDDRRVAALPGRGGRRYAEAAVARAVAEGARAQPLLAPAGTVIVFETSSIHRGAPATAGVRHALTNYYENTPNRCPLRPALPTRGAPPSAHATRWPRG